MREQGSGAPRRSISPFRRPPAGRATSSLPHVCGDDDSACMVQADSADCDTFRPEHAQMRLERWHVRLAQACGLDGPSDYSVQLERPDHRLVLLKIFGDAPYLADLCMKYPASAADVLIDGAPSYISPLSRQLTSLDWGVGGVDALRQVLLPIKHRLDLAISIALLSGAWSLEEANGARTDFAERICETVLAWLVRGAIKRGEFALDGASDILVDEKNAGEAFGCIPLAGIFVIAGSDFAHQDISWFGPLDLTIILDTDRLDSKSVATIERVMMRIGAEFRDVLEGKSGEPTLYHLKTPFGSAIKGAGLVERADGILTLIGAPNTEPERRWLASARIVAGDRRCGGDFLERAEALIWSERPLIVNRGLAPDTISREGLPLARISTIHGIFAAIADICRITLGRHRPVFRTAPMLDSITTAADAGLIPAPMAARFSAGLQTLNVLRDAGFFVSGEGAMRDQLSDQHAILSGFDNADTIPNIVTGIEADAKSCLRQLTFGPRRAFERYQTNPDPAGMLSRDPEKLEDLGFANGQRISLMIENWSVNADANEGARGAPGAQPTRFAARAPGLLTAFGETQYPNEAIKLFDRLTSAINGNEAFDAMLASEGVARGAFVDALGCFPTAIDLLIDHNADDIILAFSGSVGADDLSIPDLPTHAQEILARFPLPLLGDDRSENLGDIADWRRRIIGHATFLCAQKCTLTMIVDLLASVNRLTLEQVYKAQLHAASSAEKKALQGLAMLMGDDNFNGIPGQRTLLGFMMTPKTASAAVLETANRFCADVCAALNALDRGPFALEIDMSMRPGGNTAPLAGSSTQWRKFLTTEATAQQQIALSRVQVFAGTEKAKNTARAILRENGETSRRTQLTIRDLDRVRAGQRMRPHAQDANKAVWDIDHRDGGACDIDLIISVLMFRYSAAHPYLQDGTAREALTAMAEAGLIDTETAHSLIHAREVWQQIGVVKALSGWQSPEISPVRKRFGALLAHACGVHRYDQIGPILRGYGDDGMRLYAQIIQGRDEYRSVA